MVAVWEFSVVIGLIAATNESLELGMSNLKRSISIKMSSFRVFSVVCKSETTNIVIVWNFKGVSEIYSVMKPQQKNFFSKVTYSNVWLADIFD